MLGNFAMPLTKPACSEFGSRPLTAHTSRFFCSAPLAPLTYGAVQFVGEYHTPQSVGQALTLPASPGPRSVELQTYYKLYGKYQARRVLP